MVAEDRVPPPGIDITKPSIARTYDCFLGGKDNFAIDREIARMTLEVMPDGVGGARANRAFLRRVVRHLAKEAGIRQFLDLGSGLPSAGNVHEVAHASDPTARVVYVDNDPVVLVHARALMVDSDATTVITADVREPEKILEHPDVRRLLDFDQPLGLLMFAILHHINDDEDPEGITGTLRAALAPGSHLAISHFHNPGDERPDDARFAIEGEKLFNETLGTGRWRARDEILSYFGDMELLEPGLVPLPEWRPDPGDPTERDRTHYLFLGGVGRKT